jgi:hypothetical protein
MNEFDQAYLVPDGTDLQGIKDAFVGRYEIAEDEPRDLLRRFHDTFDWSLYHAGTVLEERSDGSRRELIWRSLRGDSPDLSWSIDHDPGLPPIYHRDRKPVAWQTWWVYAACFPCLRCIPVSPPVVSSMRMIKP